MRPKALVALVAVLVTAVVGISLLSQREPKLADIIYLLDARRDSSKPLEQALPIHQLERIYEARIIVRAAGPLGLLRDYDSVFEEFDRTRDAMEPLPMFFALDTPYTTSMKEASGDRRRARVIGPS
jgi:hypothetical protein